MFAPKAISAGDALIRSPHVLARCLYRGVSFCARGIGPMSIGVVVIKIIGHGLDDRPWNLRAARAVEVSDRKTVVHSFQSREMGTNFRG